MRHVLAVLAVVALMFAGGSSLAADPIYLDQLMEQPVAALQRQFPGLKKEGCYRVGDARYLLIEIDKKDQKPWRVVVASAPPCRRAEDIAAMDLQERAGVELGMTLSEMLRKMGRPDAAAPPDGNSKRLGDTEYFFVCRVSEGCARHTSVFIKDGTVSAISEWYSE